ncbi:RIP metalloprotease [Nocardioides mangrovicus]|uniref:RIP metalloprotease n=1 Tax=Nocardioides mangrovicus TaxID=2478913 RepID=A0A3L8P1Q3_9ACTN|nr:site-2 protease family protein [Nocardioides mangrovicus]RLV48872.1 RIP metalloprotease [Nocardioides mangrovicus]
MTVLLYILGVVVFVVGIAASIGLHEMGHMIPAKLFGVKVTQYFVGFGPTIWSRRRGETEYGFKWIPLGGYVKMVGMLPPAKGDDEHVLRKTNTGMFTQLISDARSAEYELVEPGDEERLFYRKAWWKKLIVMSGGPLVNVAIAFILFGSVFAIRGVPEGFTQDVGGVSACSAQLCATGQTSTPAQAAGFKAGDRVVSFDGTKLSGWDQLVPLIKKSAGKTVSIGVVRDGRSLTLTPTIAALPGSKDVGFLGLAPTAQYVRKGPIYTADQMGTYTKDTVVAVLHLPVRVYGVAKTVLGLQPRQADSPVSLVGAGRWAGETTSEHGMAVADRIQFLVLLLASVNLFLGMFNFVPLLPLDGGHIAGALYEAARRAWAKLFRRPDPGFFDVAKLLPVAYGVAGVFVLMTILLVYADIVDPVRI